MVPTVMGPSIESYKEKLPPNSFLHVNNCTSPAELVKYIKYLDSKNKARMKNHKWSKKYLIIYADSTMFLWVCEMCKKIDDPAKPAHNNLSGWWRPEVQCTGK